MSLNSSALDALIKQKVTAEGFDVGEMYSALPILTKAIAEAVVEHIQAMAEVPVTGGSSAGTYKVS